MIGWGASEKFEVSDDGVLSEHRVRRSILAWAFLQTTLLSIDLHLLALLDECQGNCGALRNDMVKKRHHLCLSASADIYESRYLKAEKEIKRLRVLSNFKEKYSLLSLCKEIVKKNAGVKREASPTSV